MNKQGKVENGKVVGGIEWTKTFNPDGTESQGYTWNPVRGCHHACRWTMPDGTVAICYAETIANNMPQVYTNGFQHHYWNPKVLEAPLKLQEPAKIFLDSMSDLMGAWVPEEQIHAVLDVCHRAHWHSFQLLTKNAPRLEQFDFPPNVWVGVSAPPTQMFGKQLNLDQQKRLVDRQLRALHAVRGAGVRWMSIEPLSFDIAPLLVDAPLDWVVIGAATNGMRVYQPEREWVENLLAVMDAQNIPVFFKGNLRWDVWREEFPALRPNKQSPMWVQKEDCQTVHKGVLVNDRFEMLEWVHCDNPTLVLGVMHDTETGQKRFSLSISGYPTKPITPQKADALFATGEFLPKNIDIDEKEQQNG